MLLSKITLAAAAAAALVTLAACGSEADPVEQVVEPAVTRIEQGIDAIDQSRVLACDGDRATLQTAIDAYTTLEGEPPPNEAALVGDWIREESELYDVENGVVVPVPDSGCS